MLARAAAVWAGLALVAIANGALRRFVLEPRLGDQGGHVMSAFVLSVAIVGMAWATIRWIGVTSLRAAFTVGICWLLLTVAFEFAGGHYLFRQPWSVLLADYDVQAGRVWPVVLAVTFLAPTFALYLCGIPLR
jgi:hypothetical protein